MMQLPSEATANRTTEVIEQTEKIFGQEPAVDTIVAINGFSFFGSGQNAGLAFVTLKDWSERDADNAAQSIAGRATMAMLQRSSCCQRQGLPARGIRRLPDYLATGFSKPLSAIP